MSNIYLRNNLAASLLIAESDVPLTVPAVTDAECPLLHTAQKEGKFIYTFDASTLKYWSPDTPILYHFQANGETIPFGYSELRPVQNKAILLNGAPVYLRGYIRGITAHEHPNMTGGTLKDAAVKNIRQAKKYGFNLVRFHSTIPSPEFVEAADEEGMLIHLEIGFAYEVDDQANKKNLSMNNEAWTETILRYRNHPSIAIFCIGNEMHNSGHYKEVQALYAEGRRLAPGKLIMDNSGWGEFDRQTADVYSQHIAYFFPFKHHEEMFHLEDPWLMNGSAYDEPLDAEYKSASITAKVHHTVNPARPTLAHEAIHYIEIPDYQALNKKFDDFCAKVGPEYLAKNEIKKPRFLTELPKLIERKGLTEKMPDYIKASEQFKMSSIKVYLEHCRLSSLCGFEMLQFADCLKYENKNGIVDCFDDDKYIPASWMMQFNGNAALLADFPTEVFFYGDNVPVDIHVSDFLPTPTVIGGALTLTLQKHNSNEKEVIFQGKNITLSGGLEKIASLQFTLRGTQPEAVTLLAEFTAPNGLSLKNDWDFWFFPKAAVTRRPDQLRLLNSPLKSYIEAQNATPVTNSVLTDQLDDQLLADLQAGKHVTLLYHRDAPGSKYLLPGALERYKPCIWDRGNNLGGIIYDEAIRKATASNRYFDKQWFELLNTGFKICLDHFPVPVQEFICGVDKPVRDRMKGIVNNVKNFIEDDTLRNFSHLFSVKVGKGLLTVCTLNFTKLTDPIVSSMLALLLNQPERWATEKAIAPEKLQVFLEEQTAKGPIKEDVMNHFWEIDNKLVEDTLFWEATGLDLTKIK